MIVRPGGSGQLLITQPAHAALAAHVMRHWRADGFLEASIRCPGILLAIEEHDNGWAEPDSAPSIDETTGRILDFVHAPDAVRRGVWPAGVARLAETPYAAALVAQHALHVLRRYRGDPGWAQFFAEMESLLERHLGEAAPMTIGDFLRDYSFLRVADLISLTFCNGWTDVQRDDSGTGYEIRLEGTRITVAPDPFDGREVELEIAARELPDRGYRSAAEAQEVIRLARRVLVKGVAVGLHR